MVATRLPVDVLLVGKLMDSTLQDLAASVTLLDGRDPAVREELIAKHRDTIRAIATNAHDGASRQLIESLPNLEIISCFSAGLDYVDVDAAAERGVKVTNTSDALADDVADVAIAHCLLLLRHFAKADRYVREGKWQGGPYPLGHSLSGKHLGIIGMGTIGQAIARRAEAMNMRVSYTSRSSKPELAFPFYPALAGLAEAVDILVVCCPSTPETYHIVNAEVLKALGPKGHVVNIARGAVIDEPAMIAALKSGAIAGAGLDVFEQEPGLSPAFLTMPNVSLSPHVGSATHETRAAMGRMMIDAILTHFAAEKR